MRPLTAAQEVHVLKLRRQGWTLQGLARQFHCTVFTIARVVGEPWPPKVLDEDQPKSRRFVCVQTERW